jgi:hypothetical protein
MRCWFGQTDLTIKTKISLLVCEYSHGAVKKHETVFFWIGSPIRKKGPTGSLFQRSLHFDEAASALRFSGGTRGFGVLHSYGYLLHSQGD